VRASCRRSNRQRSHERPGLFDRRRKRERLIMDNRRFDAWAKRLSDIPGTRREALRFAACSVAGLLGALGVNHSALAKKNCKKNNKECNLNRPGKCCNKQCCFDSTSNTSGTCASKEATCCSERAFGGYCPREFPICCGSDRCCEAGTECCLLTGGRGTCCDPDLGQTCIQGQGCTSGAPVSGAEANARSAGVRGIPRRLAGNK
jgi:hypothetical protein